MAPPALLVEPWSHSFATQEKLEKLVVEGLLCPVTDAVVPEWIAPGVEVNVPNPPAGYVLSFMAFHERGLVVRDSEPPVPKDQGRRERNRLFAEGQKQKKDTVNKKHNEDVRTREALEKRW
jgi:hypothetical protein